jgi:hypothetical protein
MALFFFVEEFTMVVVLREQCGMDFLHCLGFGRVTFTSNALPS